MVISILFSRTFALYGHKWLVRKILLASSGVAFMSSGTPTLSMKSSFFSHGIWLIIDGPFGTMVDKPRGGGLSKIGVLY